MMGENGSIWCSWCGTSIEGSRRHYCDLACVEADLGAAIKEHSTRARRLFKLKRQYERRAGYPVLPTGRPRKRVVVPTEAVRHE